MTNKNKYTFTHEASYTDGTEIKIEHSSNNNALSDIVNDFVDFLKGCGYNLKDLEIIKVDEHG